MNVRRILERSASAALLLTTAACGGAGGSGLQTSAAPPPAASPTPSPAPAPTPTPTLMPLISAELQRSAGARFANAQAAYSTGLSGKGVTIAVIDGGINQNSPEFAGRIDPNSWSIPGTLARCITCAGEPYQLPLQDVQGHGTAVAAFAAAAADGNNIQGMAPGATILAIKATIPEVIGDGPIFERASTDNVTFLGAINLSAYSTGVTYAVNNNAFVINASFGSTQPIPPNFGTFRSEINDAMLLVQRENRLFVSPVNNEPNSPSSENSAVNVFGVNGEFRENNLLAIALNADGTARTGANLIGTPGTFVDRALSVVAWNVPMLLLNDTLFENGGGTSFAAPIISGAVALLKERWPQLGGREIARILLDSARDAGDIGPDQLYGVGILDMERALTRPTTFVMSSAGVMLGIANTGLTTGGALGNVTNALPRQLTMMTALDTYGRDWTVDLMQNVTRGQIGGPRLSGLISMGVAPFSPENGITGIAQRQSQLTSANPITATTTGGAFSFALGGVSMISGRVQTNAAQGMAGLALRDIAQFIPGTSLALRSKGMIVSAATGRYLQGKRQQIINQINLHLTNGLSFGLANLSENGQVLGSQGSGAFGIGRANTVLYSAGYQAALGQVQLRATATLGQTRVQGLGILQFERLVSQAFDASAAMAAGPGVLEFSFASPLRFTTAPAALTLANGYNLAEQRLNLVTQTVNLAPQAREMDLGVRWTTALPLGQLDVGVRRAFNAGQIEGITSNALWMGLSTRW